MANTQYTELQKKIIHGEIPLESVDGRVATWLYRKALANNDIALAEKALLRIKQAKDEAKKRNSERTVKYRALRRKGVHQWKQPKSPNYTEYQKKIVRGEIPFEEIRGTDLSKIYQKAVSNGDDVLAESILELIHYRNEQWIKKDKRWIKDANRNRCPIESFEDFDPNSRLSKWEQAILKGAVDVEDFFEEDIKRIIRILEVAQDEENLKAARLLLQYKQDPSTLYVTNNHWKAVDIIEELIQLPIRRPNTWFPYECK